MHTDRTEVWFGNRPISLSPPGRVTTLAGANIARTVRVMVDRKERSHGGTFRQDDR